MAMSATTRTASVLTLQAGASREAARLPELLLEAERIAGSMMMGLHGRHRAGPGEHFWQYRPYDVSDDRKMIDWRLSARSPSRLYIRQTEWESAETLFTHIANHQGFDFSHHPDTASKRQRALLLGAALSILLNRSGERVGLIFSAAKGEAHNFGDRIFAGRDAPARFCRALLDQPQEQNPQMAGLPHAKPPIRALYISDFYQPLEPLIALIKQGASLGVRGVLLQICDPSEEDFPFAGRVSFFDRSGAPNVDYGDAGAVRGDYRQVFLAHRESLAAACRRHGWQFCYHRTDRPALSALIQLHHLLSGESLGAAIKGDG